MFSDAYPQLSVWAALSAPLCAIYAVASADRDVGVRLPKSGLVLWVAATLATLTVASASWAGEGLAALVLVCGLAYLAVFDVRALAIPVWPVLALTALGLATAVWSGASERLLAAAAGIGAFSLLGAIYRLLRGRDGLGEGDGLVAALLGAWLSFEGLAWSVAIGGFAGIAYVFVRRHGDAPMPLVPALAVGAAVYLIARSVTL